MNEVSNEPTNTMGQPVSPTGERVAFLLKKGKIDAGLLGRAIGSLLVRGIEIDVRFLDEISDPVSELKTLKRSPVTRALVCGGDGTLHSVVTSLMQLPKDQRIPIGVVPMGTANDFATASAFGGLTLENAILASAEAPLHPIEVGIINGHPFVNVATGGAFTRATTEASETLKSLFGRFAYYLNAIASLPDLGTFDLKAEGQGWSLHTSCLAFAIGNGSTAGGGLKLAPEAKLNDGLLDLLVIPPHRLLELTALATELLSEAPEFDGQNVIYKQAREFTLETSEEIQVNLDGEPIRGRFFHVRCEPVALEFAAQPDALLDFEPLPPPTSSPRPSTPSP